MIENNEELKYQYHLYTWGGFYNKEYFEIHKETRGNHWFDTEEERRIFIDKLKTIEENLNARTLMISVSEGYCCNIETRLHRVIEWEGKRYYSEEGMGINYPISAAQYHMEWKWYPGFNDYPLGKEFDYDKNKVIVIQEWITGALQISEEFES